MKLRIFLLLALLTGMREAFRLPAQQPDWRERLERSAAALEALERRVAEQQKEIDSLREEIKQLRGEAGIAETERKSPQSRPDSMATAAQAPMPLAGWDGARPYLESADGEHRMEVPARGQLDFRGYSGTATPANTFVLRRARPFGSRPGRGAWEAAFRYARLRISDSVNPNTGESNTFGVSLWLKPYVRHRWNAVYERFEDPLRATSPGRRGHVGYLRRMQSRF